MYLLFKIATIYSIKIYQHCHGQGKHLEDIFSGSGKSLGSFGLVGKIGNDLSKGL